MALLTSCIKTSTVLSISQKLIGLHVTTKIPLTASKVKLFSNSSAVQGGQFELPKRPNTAFFRFKKDAELLLDEQSKKKKLTERSVILGEKWHQLPQGEKQVYIDQVRQDQEEYKKKLSDIQNDPNLKDQLLVLEQEKLRKRTEKAARKARLDKKDLMKNLGRPKLPPNPYALFFVEQRKKYKNIVSQEATKQIAESWKVLNQDDKEKYVAEYKPLKEKYAAELEAWKLKMLEDDKMDDVSKAQQTLNKKRAHLTKLNKG